MSSTLDLIVNLLGLGILLWLLGTALIDLFQGNQKRTLFHNLIIVVISLVYALKILLKDLLAVV